MTPHPVYKVVAFEVTGPHALRAEFDDGTAQAGSADFVLFKVCGSGTKKGDKPQSFWEAKLCATRYLS